MTLGCKLTTCDGKPLSKAASKIPVMKSKVAGRKGVIDHNRLNHQMLVHTVDKLWKYPQFVKSIHTTLFSDDFPIPEGEDILDMTVAWLTVKQPKNVPRTWKAQFLVERNLTAGLTYDLMNSLATLSEDNVDLLFELELQVPGTMVLAKDLQGNSTLCNLTFNTRAAQVGDRVSRLLASGGLHVGGVDLSKGGSYSLIFGEALQENFIIKIKHCSGATIDVPEHCPVDRRFKLKDNYSDKLASLVFQKTSHVLITWFLETEPFVKLALPKKNDEYFKDALAQAKTAHDTSSMQDKAAAQALMKSRTALDSANVEKASVRTVKAKASIAEKKNARASRRIIKLDC
jgi:hypothetical protein